MPQGQIEGKNIQMITPENDGLVYAKKPVIECSILVPFVEESLYVEFDMTDISALVKVDGDRLKFRPVQVVQPGAHRLVVVFTTLGGEEIMEQFQFSTRHSKVFETAYSTNRISGGYARIIKKYQDAKDREMSDWEAEANLGTENLLSQGPWAFSFKANGRYYDQQNPIEEPLEDTLELVDFLFTGKYEKSKYMVETSVGDIITDESRNTVSNLSRRGGKLVAEYGPAGLSGFVVRSDQIYGSDGDYGLELDSDDHILGVSGDLDLFKKKANVKAIYVTGGTQPDEDSFGTWDEVGGTKGDVKGIVLATDFFEQKFATSFEFDRSDYDSDISDNISSESDKAYYLKAEGLIKKFSYIAEYEHTGLDYQVPGSSIRSDWEGYTLKSNLAFEKHSFGASYSKHNDDVEHDDVNGRTDYTEYMFDYGLNVFTSVPMTFSWFKNIEKNQVSVIDSYTDTYSSSISYMKNAFNLFFTPSYSKTNDKTIYDYDSSNTCLNLSGSYYKERFSIQPSIGFNRYKDYSTDVYTDTDTYSLTVAVTIIENLCIDNTGSFSHITASDDSIDQDCISNDFQLTYKHPNRIWGIFSPRASLCTSYEKIKDRIMGTESEETIVYMRLSGDFEISF
ncbi:MAG: hypothetical protein KAJ62_00655 [Desulfobacteraceae bacterium]|nr:hypothetical protein [Desulfobacteraceae bacterium]